MAYRRDRQVNTKIRPEKMVGGQTQHFKDLLDGCFFKPGKFRIGKRQLCIVDKHPDTMPRDIYHLGRKSVAPAMDDLQLTCLEQALCFFVPR